MPVLGLTGGIATGKSTFTQALLQEKPMGFFDSDRCVHELLDGDETIRHAIVSAFGPETLNPAGWPDRSKLREIVFTDAARRKTLEAILHPAVRSRWTAEAVEARRTNAWLLVDIPLLYETGAAGEFDRVIVVACSRSAQLQRLTEGRGLAPELAARMIAAQLELDAKTQKSDHLIWNDSTVPNLTGQARHLARWLERRFA